jgi:DNA processing protein
MHVAGEVRLLDESLVAVIGSRVASSAGLQLATAVAREVVALGHVVVSGLAAGIYTAAHRGAIAAGGRTLAVIGTCLEQAYPPDNAWLQQQIYREHLLVSPFPPGSSTRRSNFPIRNRLVATLVRATVLVEAGETSGTVHQVRQARALGRPVFVSRSAARSSWVRALAEVGGVRVWDEPRELRTLLALV